MRVLAIDTALEACSAAVLDTERGMLASETRLMARGHAEALIPLIARVMGEAATPFAELDRIAVTTGPGSFTGLRVGISAARGIALSTDKPALGDHARGVRRAVHRRRRHAIAHRRNRRAPRARLSTSVRAGRAARWWRRVSRASRRGAHRRHRPDPSRGHCRARGRRGLAGKRVAAGAGRGAQRARHRLGGAARRGGERRRQHAQAALSARARRAAEAAARLPRR